MLTVEHASLLRRDKVEIADILLDSGYRMPMTPLDMLGYKDRSAPLPLLTGRPARNPQPAPRALRRALAAIRRLLPSLLLLPLGACYGSNGEPLIRAGGQYSGVPDSTVGDWRQPLGTMSTGGAIHLHRESNWR